MKNLAVAMSITIIAACSLPAQLSGYVDGQDTEAPGPVATAPPAREYQYVGTYEHIDTPMGGSISVLMAENRKIRIAMRKWTAYVNLPMLTELRNKALEVPMPEILLGGTYGVNGDWSRMPFDSSELYVVSDMEYLGGGNGAAHERKRRHLPDFYSVDVNATGPLTLAELEIRFPESLKRYFNDDERACFFRQVELRATEMGDPLTMEPRKRGLLFLNHEAWERSTVAEKRLQMARYVTSMALSDC